MTLLYRARKLTVIISLASFFSCCAHLTSYQSGDALKSIYADRVTTLHARYGSLDAPNPSSTPNPATGRTPSILEAAATDAEKRNALLNDFIFLIDANYDFWEKISYNKKAFGDFGSDFSAATLSTLSGIVTGGGVQGAKSILSFISAGIISTKASFNQDVLQNQSLIAMLASIRANRAAKLVPLQSGMYLKSGSGNSATVTARPINQYSLNQGLVDLLTYYQAGTFVGGFQDLIDKAGAQKAAAQSVINQTIKNVPSIDTGFGSPTPKPTNDQ
ncbi:MAG: hypothetical protein ACREIF_10755 [Chthoniobacterales bacterium]